MVPPIFQGGGIPIVRSGDQQTYVFFKDGVESFVIRPGYQGKVEEFGMLIPFPSAPAVRKVSDNIFPHIAAAVDPPEVVIDLTPSDRYFSMPMAAAESASAGLSYRNLARDEVRVVNREAVGMYDVAVLEAGSAGALKKWMDKNGFKFPDGMETVCEQYVAESWCFVAVKTKVGAKDAVDAQPGQRRVAAGLPAGSTFDGHVQAMGFRFKTKELVVPMRLSAFNGGDLRNIVYLLTDGPRRIRNIPDEFVVRQIKGNKLVSNLTQPLPLRIIGGTEKDLQPYHRSNLTQRRDPTPKNGAAKQLFAADLVSVDSGELTLAQEKTEKELLKIGERLGLRGDQIDKLNREQMEEVVAKTNERAMKLLAKMTLTVVDGDFPREVLAGENLTFSEYKMPTARNNAARYNARLKKANPNRRKGKLILEPVGAAPRRSPIRFAWTLPIIGIGLAGFRMRKSMNTTTTVLLVLCLAISLVSTVSAQEGKNATSDLIKNLADSAKANDAIRKLVEIADSRKARDGIVPELLVVAQSSDHIQQRGWSMVALSEIGGLDVDEALLKIHSDESQTSLVRNWAAAARVAMSRSTAALIEKAQLIQKFPALGRPISVRLVDALKTSDDVTAEQLLQTSIKVPQIAESLTPMIMGLGTDALLDAMTGSKDQNVRRQAAAFLGAIARENPKEVADKVIATYTFTKSDDVPWKGGPLFIPGIRWDKDSASRLVGELVAWNVWADQNNQSDLQRQIHNNLRSVGLSRVVGYQTPNFQFATPAEWLKAWGAVAGKDAVQKLLSDQGLSDAEAYR
jgi:hypothetical protein